MGAYSFKLLAYDAELDNANKNHLAYGEAVDQSITNTSENKITINLKSLINSASLSSSPRDEIQPIVTEVNPNAPIDIFLYVHPENRTDLFVPEDDYTVKYGLGTESLTGSQLGVRFPLGCDASTFQSTVTGLQFEEGNYIEKALRAVTLDFTPSPNCVSIVGIDIAPPYVEITTEEDANFAGTVTLEGEVNDLQSGIDRVKSMKDLYY